VPFSTLHSRHIVITGASRGIGRALAQECARRGAHVSLCARSNSIQDLVSRLAAVGGVLDVRDPDAVGAWIEMAVRQFGPIDALVNNAGILGPKCEVAEYPVEQWREVLDINSTGPFVVTKAALPHLRRPGGLAVFLTSYLGRFALPRYGAYCASKFAVEGLARLVAEEHRSEGIVSCAIDPGMVQTEMLKAAAETDDVSEHPTTEQAAAAFADQLERLSANESGQTIPLFPEP